MERKVFSKEDLAYMVFAMSKVGCYGIDEEGKEYNCPYWDWELKDEENRDGDCLSKHSQKLCILLEVAKSGELCLALRDKTSEDQQKEQQAKKELLQRKIDLIEQDVIIGQQKLDELERRKKKLGA